MAVVNPIPGQESRNRDFLVENGAAIKINNLATLTLKLELLPRDPLFFDHHAESDVIDALPGRESQAEGRG